MEENSLVKDINVLEPKKKEYTKEEIAMLKEIRRKQNIARMRALANEPKQSKIGRNDPCPCGSGKKYKNCCGKNQ